MTEYVYVGRRRPLVKVIVYQLLTVGIYGRVLLYKLLREFDGHEALFLDRRPYVLLLVLPFVGPLFVKRRIASLLQDLVHHDVTSKAPSRRRLNLIAWVPLAPWFHWRVQAALNQHWKMHTKEEELSIKRNQLAALERKSRTKENLEAGEVLRKEVAVRAKELEDLKAAAIALREAEEVRNAAERELKRSGLGRRRLSVGMVRKMLPTAAFRRRGAATQDTAMEPPAEELEATSGPPERTPTLPRGKREGPKVEAFEEVGPEEPPAAHPKTGGLFGFLRRGKEKPSKEAKRAEKEARKAARRLEKENETAEKASTKDEAAPANVPPADEPKPPKETRAAKGGRRKAPPKKVRK